MDVISPGVSSLVLSTMGTGAGASESASPQSTTSSLSGRKATQTLGDDSILFLLLLFPPRLPYIFSPITLTLSSAHILKIAAVTTS